MTEVFLYAVRAGGETVDRFWCLAYDRDLWLARAKRRTDEAGSNGQSAQLWEATTAGDHEPRMIYSPPALDR